MKLLYRKAVVPTVPIGHSLTAYKLIFPPDMWNNSTKHSPCSTLIPMFLSSSTKSNPLIINILKIKSIFWHRYCHSVIRENKTT